MGIRNKQQQQQHMQANEAPQVIEYSIQLPKGMPCPQIDVPAHAELSHDYTKEEALAPLIMFIFEGPPKDHFKEGEWSFATDCTGFKKAGKYSVSLHKVNKMLKSKVHRSLHLFTTSCEFVSCVR